MPSASQPLFAPQRRSSTHSEERAAHEDDALLGNHRKEPNSQRSLYGLWREVGLFVWAVVATAAVIVLAVLSQHQSSLPDKPKNPSGKRNLIFMVSDGMGPASLSLTRSFRQYTEDLPFGDGLVLDQHFIGSSRTRSSSSLVTDSAAGATAFSCGKKSYNGAISILPDHTPCGTVLEAAKKAGYMTGLVVTTSLTDATPACFASHARIRSEEDLIAEQEVGNHPLGRVVDLMFGGGRCHFMPNTTSGSCRGDDRDIIKLAQEEHGWRYINSRPDFDELKLRGPVMLPLLGLFAGNDFPFEIDRRKMDDQYPSLEEMARTAVTVLEAATADSDKGFFLMIEGSRIDHAGHANDPAAQVHEVLAYDRAFASVVEFLERSDVDGALVATSDHETGGLAVARQLHATYPGYLWYPGVLANASNSASHLAQRLKAEIATSSFKSDDLKKHINKEYIQRGLGIEDATEAELQLIVENPSFSAYFFADMISRRAQIGWSTHGHTAVDVNIYGTVGSSILRGNHENTDVGKFLREYLDVNVDAVTEELNKKSKALNKMDVEAGWTGKIPTGEELQIVLQHHEETYGKSP